MLVRDCEQGQGSVLIEHPGLVHDDSLTWHESGVLRRAGVGRARLRVRVTRREARPHAVAVPPPSVLVHELRHAVRRHAEFLVGDVGGLLRRCHHAGRAVLGGGRFDRGPEHGGLARTRGALHDNKRIT